MADTNEEQLLSDLLRDLAREDARIDAAHLEARVMSAAARSTPASFGATRSAADAVAKVRLKPDTTYRRARSWVVVAAVAVAVLVPATFWLATRVPDEKAQVKVSATGPAEAEHYVLPRVAKSVKTPSNPIAPSRITPSPITESPVTESPIAQSPITQSPIAQAPITESRDEFVPLMPMTELELTGSFQLVRVQMPRASLGTLGSPFEHPNELVEADVLLGQDGMARAIRVSTSGSVYPWRFR